MIRLYICLASAVVLVACNSVNSGTKKAEQISRSVSDQYIPDSREDLFQIQFKTKGESLLVFGETTNLEAKKALIDQLKSLTIPIEDSIRFLPDPALGGNTWGLVNVSVCNIRSKSGHSSEMSTQAILGTPVRILKKSNSWLFVQTPDRYLGWVDDDAIQQTDSAGIRNWRHGKRFIYLPLAGTGFDPVTKEAVTDLVAGSILKFDTISKAEALLEMPDGRKLVVPASDGLDFEFWKKQTQATAATLSATSKTLTGRPYLWGGTSSKGVDCSGFVKTAFFLNGIILARDASLQFRHGQFTNPDSGYNALKPGDLVFFGRKAEGDRPARATHVGLYLGNGDYINSSGCVKINSFSPDQKTYAKSRAGMWLGGRTILGSEGTKGIVRVRDHPWY
ncbi:MAG: C40 family peptidase [Prolixibacteraceae bacterium]